MFRKTIIVLLVIILIVGLLSIYFLYNPSENTYFLKCPFKSITGYDCAGCGSQRALHQLLHSNVISAFKLNPLLIVSLPLIIYALYLKVHNYLFNTSYRVKLFYKKWFIYTFFGCALLFWIFRNTSWYLSMK